MTYTSIRSVEAFRMVYGRTPTVAEFRACMGHDQPTVPTPKSNGCDCYDPECSWCCDEDGNAR
jgi:hypothetical protein